MLNSSIWPIDRTLSGSTTLGLGRPGSDGNEEVLCIPHSSSITGASPSDCLLSYLIQSLLAGSYPSAEIQLVYSADWAILWPKILQNANGCSTKYWLNLFKFLSTWFAENPSLHLLEEFCAIFFHD